MTNEQKLERASQLRREAMALENSVKETTPCCSYCEHLAVNGMRSPRVYKCLQFQQEVPVEFTQVPGNGCASYSWDSVPFSLVAHENH